MDVKTYLDIHQYLQDYYAARKQQEKSFSYQSWADEMASSKTYLRFAVLGKRSISEKLALKICKFIGLSKPDQEHFLALVIYTQTRDLAERQKLAKNLVQSLRFQSNVIEMQPNEKLLSDPLVMTVRNVLSFSDVPRTAEFLAQLFSLSLTEMDEILLLLAQENFIEKWEGQWRAVQDSVRTQSTQPNLAIQNYHRLSLLKALEAQKLPLEQRSFKSLSLAFGASEYQEFLQDLNEFFKKTFTKFNTSLLASKKMYQINFNIIPWTKEALVEPSAPISERAEL